MTGLSKPRFAARGAFSRELKERADRYFEERGGDRRDMPRMVLKSMLLLAWLGGSWALLTFAATELWQALPLAISIGLAIAGIGMGIQHDANHGAYSRHANVNSLFRFSLDMMGVSSFIWRQKHNVLHHTFTNIEPADFDLDFGVLARLTDAQRRRPWHRFQHIYLWAFYGLLLPKWVLIDDFVHLFTGRTGPHSMPKPAAGDLVLFAAGKVFFLTWAVLIPWMFHPLSTVLIFLFISVFVMGVTLSIIFQLAHCVGEAEFSRDETGKRVQVEWTVHQIATTVDFARGNRWLTWFSSGLSYQVEHHLFPKVCHLHYPALALIVEEVAAKHGIRYRSNRTLFDAIASHYRLLRRLGMRVA